jgi:hypothetical protein
LLAAWVGKPQMLPSPTADPAAARIKPNRDLNSPRCAAKGVSLKMVCDARDGTEISCHRVTFHPSRMLSRDLGLCASVVCFAAFDLVSLPGW